MTSLTVLPPHGFSSQHIVLPRRLPYAPLIRPSSCPSCTPWGEELKLAKRERAENIQRSRRSSDRARVTSERGSIPAPRDRWMARPY